MIWWNLQSSFIRGFVHARYYVYSQCVPYSHRKSYQTLALWENSPTLQATQNRVTTCSVHLLWLALESDQFDSLHGVLQWFPCGTLLQIEKCFQKLFGRSLVMGTMVCGTLSLAFMTAADGWFWWPLCRVEVLAVGWPWSLYWSSNTFCRPFAS